MEAGTGKKLLIKPGYRMTVVNRPDTYEFPTDISRDQGWEMLSAFRIRHEKHVKLRKL